MSRALGIRSRARSPTYLGVFAGLGVKIIQLTYNVANQLGHGSMVPENGGLTDFGRDVVAELNAANTLVDLSHSGEQTCLDGIDASTAPVAITHTGCRAVTDLPRNSGHLPQAAGRPHFRDVITRPGTAIRISPSSTTNSPPTSTWSMPVECWCGSTKVA